MKFRLSKSILCMLALGLVGNVGAAIWTGTTDTSWATASNWSDTTTPNGIISYEGTVSNTTQTLDGNWAIDGIIFSASNGVTINKGTGSALSIGASGIDMSAAGANLTINTSITSAAEQNWHVAAGRTLTLAGGGNTLNIENDITLTGDGIVAIGAASTGSTTLSGSANLNINSGTLAWGTQSGSSIAAYTGAFVLNGGRISINTSNSLPKLIINSGTIGSHASKAREVSSDVTIAGDFTIGGNETANVVGNITNAGMTFSGAVDLSGGAHTINMISNVSFTGSVANGTMIKSGNGLLLLGSSVDMSSASLDIQQGSVKLTDGKVSIANLSGAAGTTIDSNYNTAGDNARTLDVTQTVDGIYAGTISSDGGTSRKITLVKNGSANLTLSGTNTYNGGTTVNAGTLTVANNSALGSGSVNLNGGKLDLGGYAVGNNIVLAGGTLIGGSGYTGTLSGTSGRLEAGTDASKVYNIAAGGLTLTELVGQGTFSGGMVTVTGTYGPGNSIGTQTFNNGLTLNGGTMLEIAGNGLSSDKINVTGGLILGADSSLSLTMYGNVDYSAVFWDSDHSFTLISTDSLTGDFSEVDLSGLGTTGEGSWTAGWNGNDFELNWTANAIPEPSSLGLFGLGLAGMLLRRRRKQA